MVIEAFVAWLLLLLTSVALLVIGYLLYFRHMIGLINGIDPAKVRSKEGLARVVGGHLFALAAICLFMALTIWPIGLPELLLLYAIAIVVVLIRMALKARKHYY